MMVWQQGGVMGDAKGYPTRSTLAQVGGFEQWLFAHLREFVKLP